MFSGVRKLLDLLSSGTMWCFLQVTHLPGQWGHGSDVGVTPHGSQVWGNSLVTLQRCAQLWLSQSRDEINT